MLTFSGEHFYLNGKEFNIYSGSIHYFRVHPDYWEDRLLKLKAAGFNTVETYVSWNLHEPTKGNFIFEGMLDIYKFIKTAEKVGLYAIVRPGPYICAEWDFGGLPHWLLKDKSMKIRCYYEPYLSHVRDFYQKLLSIINPLQITKGGNIIGMQIENEYGSYGSDKPYLRYIEKLMLDLGTDVLLFTSDGTEKYMLSGGTLEHILPTANFGSNSTWNFKKLDEFRNNIPKVCMEFWLGWFDHWGKRHHIRNPKSVAVELGNMLKKNQNFNLFMFHGGTNFGFTNGANYHSEYGPTTTSYDYDAPLNEYGHYTKKYHLIRELMHKHQKLNMDDLPKEVPLQTIGRVHLAANISLFDNMDILGTTHKSIVPERMEHYDLFNGLILYEHTASANYFGKLSIDGLADRAYIYLNGIRKGIIYRNDKNQFINIGKVYIGDKISVLVESMGRINYGYKLYDRKGVEQIRLDLHVLTHFDTTTFALNNLEKTNYEKTNSGKYPLILTGVFKAELNKDCFVHFDNLTKGCIYVNGFNLGRYWEVGPQKSLYIPAPILEEENTITVLELEKVKSPHVDITNKHKFK